MPSIVLASKSMRFVLSIFLACAGCGNDPAPQQMVPPSTIVAAAGPPVCADASGAEVEVSGTLTDGLGGIDIAIDGSIVDSFSVAAPGPFDATVRVPNGRHDVTVCFGSVCSDVLQVVVACACTGVSCDDGNACTNDLCDPMTGCSHVDLARCATPGCGLGACAGPDSDGDGFSDAWETQGYVDLNCNGVNDASDLPLPAADPHKPNVYVEYDYMEKPGAGNACSDDSACTVAGEQCIGGVCTHSHRPLAIALDAVVASFAAHGVILTIDPAPERLPESAVISFGTTPGTRTLDAACVGTDAVNFYDLKDAHFDARRARVYHYVVFGHLSSCPSGLCAACPADAKSGFKPQFGATGMAELPGDDAIVSLGRAYFDLSVPQPRTRERDGGTFMHELGHNLGLRHGGDADGPPLKPNYLSVMNGQFQLVGIRYADTAGSTTPNPALTRIDYSDATLPTLDESSLMESAGLGAGNNAVVYFLDGMSNDAFAPGTGAADWSGNGSIDGSPVSADINGDGAISTLTGWNDWAHLTVAFQCVDPAQMN